MDYKKKYNEALERARQLCAYPTTKPFISDLQDLFPELKESEDEKIIKALIDEVSRWSEDTGFGRANIPRNKILAWLEKQGEQVKPNWLQSLRPQMQWKAVDKEIYVKEPALAQRKDKSEPNHGYVICYDHTLTPDVYERFIMISDIYNQSHWKPSEKQMKWLHDAIESTQYEPRKQALISLYSDLMGLKD